MYEPLARRDKATNYLGYNDVLGDVRTALTGAAQWTEAQIRDTGFIIPWLRFDQSDYFQIKIQFPHDKKLMTPIASIHAHVIGDDAHTGTVVYSYAYTWVKLGDAVPALSSWVSDTITFTFDKADQYKHIIHPIVTNIKPIADESYSSILFVKITRVGGSDTYTGDIGLLYLDAHYVSEKLGSYTEYTD